MENNKELVSKAMEKINLEMNKENNPYVKVIGEFLIQQVNGNEEVAKAILTEGKTIMKSLDEMKKVAKQRAINGCAMLTDEEGFTIVLKYYGIDGANKNKSSNKVVSINDYKEKSTLEGIDINLDDILDNL